MDTKLRPAIAFSTLAMAAAWESPGEPAAAAAPAPAATRTAAQVGAQAGALAVTTKAVELRIDGVTTVPRIGSRQARSGYEFVIVDTSWKNVIPKPTPFVVPMLRKQFWLFTDDRFADTVDLAAQAATAGAFPAAGFTIATLGDVIHGKLVFEAPAGSHDRAFQFYDNNHGHALIPLGGSRPVVALPTAGPAGQNALLQAVLAEAGFVSAGAPPAGQRHYTVSVRGISRSPTDIVEIQPQQFVFIQNEHACVAQPVIDAPWLTRPMAGIASFPPTSPNEEQLAFVVPEESRRLRLLIRPARAGAITLPAGDDFDPSWPTPQHTIEDGSTMKLHVIGAGPAPAGLSSEAGGELVVLDFVAENLKPNQGIDFQGTLQLRLMDSAGGFIQPSSLSGRLTCTLGETGVIPAASARRFRYVYEIPAALPLKLQYRGFERDEVVIEVRR